MSKFLMYKTKRKIFITIVTFALFFGAFGFSYAKHVQQKKIENELLQEADSLMVYIFHDIFTLHQQEIVSIQSDLHAATPHSFIELTTGEKIGFLGTTVVSTFGEIQIENTKIELLPPYSITERSSADYSISYEVQFTLRHKQTNITSTFNNEIPIITQSNP